MVARNPARIGLFAAALLLLWPAAALAGYSHYWTWQVDPPPEQTKACAAEMRKIVESRPDLVELVHFDDPTDQIAFNGIGELAHEPFIFPGHRGFNFCKTFGKPYDAVVTAALLQARACFPATQLDIRSDGSWVDWAEGRALYQKVTGREPIDPLPESDAPPFGGVGVPGLGLPRGSGRTFGLVGIMGLALLLWRFFAAGRPGGDGLGWGSYYLFWLVAPTAVAVVSAHPLALAVIPVALVTRRWLPDPYLWVRRHGRIQALRAQIHANPANATARRQLAMLYLEQRKPHAALPMIERALDNEPESAELHYLHGLCLLGARHWEPAIEAFGEVLRREPRFRYGDPFLRAADALVELRRWADAEESLDHFLHIHGSSLQGWCRLATVRRRRGDMAGARAARVEARKVYAQLPGFQRKQQTFWYFRSYFA